MNEVEQVFAGLQTPEEVACFEQLMVEWAAEAPSATAEDLTAVDYATEPVDVRSFVEDPYYLGLAGQVWPVLVDDLERLFHEGDYREVVLKGAIGWGKS
ncbi:MAG: hypothetical protein ACT4PO_14495, partial [Actinomycetota bacterium]